MTRTRVSIIAGFALLAVLLAGFALYRGGDEQPRADLTVSWGGSEWHPSCVYDAKDQAVRATLTIEGYAGSGRNVTAKVTAYADENTSVPVGSGSRTVRVEATTRKRILVTFPVAKAPKVDIDGETACRLSVNQSR